MLQIFSKMMQIVSHHTHAADVAPLGLWGIWIADILYTYRPAGAMSRARCPTYVVLSDTYIAPMGFWMW